MMEFNNSRYGEVVVLGHVMLFDNNLIDMRNPQWAQELKDEYEGDWSVTEDEHNQIGRDLKGYLESITHHLETNFEWGNNEQAKEFALESDNRRIRSMAALNGWFPEILCRDENSFVRASVVDGVVMQKKLGASKEQLNNLEFLTQFHLLAYDDSKMVRRRIASYGSPEYMTDLVGDCDASVRQAVAKATSLLVHLDVLAKDDDVGVRLTVAKNKHFCAFDLLADDEDQIIRSVIQERQARFYRDLALYTDPEHAQALLENEDEYVRKILALRGIGLDVLVNDPSDTVRAAVAQKGGCLDKLIHDSSNKVKAVATAYPVSLALPY